jgi:alkanesulfonate monooxygenase SsuD/methylene tetrahydromethanopterin reductase-like flavin-dependent oxidoreductase (luciferase family)
VKASFMCSTTYLDPAAHNYGGGWPVPPRLFDSSVGQQTYDSFLEWAALADELGFDWVSVSEHHYAPLIIAPSTAVMAGALTQVVRRARIALLGPLAPVNNPVRTAEEIAMLDHLSHGRLIVLPLRGTLNEFSCYAPVDPAQTKSMTQEATRLIQKALSEPEPFSWQGEHFQFPRISVWPRPLQQPFPPMYFSGNSPDSALFAAANRLGVCFSFHSPQQVAATLAAYREEAARAGWAPTPQHMLYRGFIVVADTEAEAAKLAENFVPVSMAASIEANKRHQLSGSAAALPEDWARGSSAKPDQGPVGFGLGRLLFAGTPDMIVERIRAFHEATGVGVMDFIFTAGQTPPEAIRRGIELFGREVLPRIRGIGEPSAVNGAVTQTELTTGTTR